jgi:hypothetical protein
MIDTETDLATAIKYSQGQLVVKRTQDTTPYLEANKRERTDFQARRGARMRKVAEIPNIVVEQWMREGINIFDRNHAAAIQRKLNSNEFAHLRTSPGKCKVT